MSSTPHSPLMALPNEIKLEIAENLCPHCIGLADATHGSQQHTLQESHVHALSSLSKTCKAWKAVAQPILFHKFTWKERDDNRNRHMRQLRLFIRTMTEQPELGKAVKQLRGPEPTKIWRDNRNFLRVESEAIVSLLGKRHPRKLSKRTPLKNLPSILSSIVLDFTPNIQEMEVVLCSTRLRATDPSTRLTFPKLKRLVVKEPEEIWTSRKESPYSEQLADLLMSAPNLVELGLVDIPSWQFKFPVLTAPPLKVKRLSMNRYHLDLSNDDIQRVLAAVPSVEDIRIDASSGTFHSNDIGNFIATIAAIPLQPLSDDQGRRCLDKFTKVTTSERSRAVAVSRRHDARESTMACEPFGCAIWYREMLETFQ